MAQINDTKLTKNAIYQTIEKKALEKGLNFKPLDKDKGAEKGFVVFNSHSTIYGNIMSNINKKDIYQGLTLKLYEFFETNNSENFVILLDLIDNHLLVLPYKILKSVLYDVKNDKNKNSIHKTFHISRNPYQLKRNKLNLEKYKDNLDLIFNGQNSEQNELLEKIIETTKNELKNNPQLKENEESVISQYGSLFNLQNIDTLTKENFASFLLYKNNKHWKGLHRQSNTITKDMDKLKTTLKLLLDESKPIEDRLNLIMEDKKYRIAFLGKAILTPILLVAYPQKYAVYNEVSEEVMRYFNLTPKFTNERFGEKYKKINNIISDLAEIHQLSLWQMDYVWWDALPEIKNKENQIPIYITGYDKINLEISKKNLILGWKDKPQSLSSGNYVFVYNSDEKVIDSCFKILKPSKEEKPIWKEEKGKQKVFSHRFDVELLADNINITKDEIFNLEPFKINKRDFSLLIRNNHPRKLDSTKYESFRKMLIECIQNLNHKKYTLEMLQENTYIDLELLKEWENILSTKKQVVFYGPPGTGKTFVATEFAQYIQSKYGGKYTIIQFHPSYSYEDFIEGIKPQINKDGQMTYDIDNGIFKEFCSEAESQKSQKFILIIDEINRGNLAKIFGELMFLLEYRTEQKQIKLPYSKSVFSIPENIWMIGTMNSTDRSIALVDYALRRRFYFIEMMPDKSIIENFYIKNESEIPYENIIEFFELINASITNEGLGKHFQIGHSFFLEIGLNAEKLRIIWKYSIKPLLEEYYFETPERIRAFEDDFENKFDIKIVNDLEAQ